MNDEMVFVRRAAARRRLGIMMFWRSGEVDGRLIVEEGRRR